MRNACSCNSYQSHSWTCSMGGPPGRLESLQNAKKSGSSTPSRKKKKDEQLKLEELREL